MATATHVGNSSSTSTTSTCSGSGGERSSQRSEHTPLLVTESPPSCLCSRREYEELFGPSLPFADFLLTLTTYFLLLITPIHALAESGIVQCYLFIVTALRHVYLGSQFSKNPYYYTEETIAHNNLKVLMDSKVAIIKSESTETLFMASGIGLWVLSMEVMIFCTLNQMGVVFATMLDNDCTTEDPFKLSQSSLSSITSPHLDASMWDLLFAPSFVFSLLYFFLLYRSHTRKPIPKLTSRATETLTAVLSFLTSTTFSVFLFLIPLCTHITPYITLYLSFTTTLKCEFLRTSTSRRPKAVSLAWMFGFLFLGLPLFSTHIVSTYSPTVDLPWLRYLCLFFTMITEVLFWSVVKLTRKDTTTYSEDVLPPSRPPTLLVH